MEDVVVGRKGVWRVWWWEGKGNGGCGGGKERGMEGVVKASKLEGGCGGGKEREWRVSLDTYINKIMVFLLTYQCTFSGI
jgi:hypothetical protein